MTIARKHLLLLALGAAFGTDAVAQLPAAPQVTIESTPEQPPQAQPAPAAEPGFAAPTVIITANPVPEVPAVAPVPATPPGITSPTVTIQSNPGAIPPSPAAGPIPAAATAVAPPPGPPVSTPTPDGIGTTIIGEQEAPIGLYITPWKDDYAERGLDRPARLVDEAMEPIDPATFRRQIEYYETITEFRRKQRGEAK